MNDQEEDKKLAALAIAPRVTLDQLKATVKSVEYISKVTEGGQVIRWAVLTCQNGFGVTGRPGVAVSPLNDIPEFGEKVAYDNAFNELWPLLGYELKSKLALIEAAGQPSGSITKVGAGVQTYVGTKVVRGVAMNRAEYNTLRGWQLPANENGGDDGYLVEYTDGGAPNQEGFVGYISWSPKDVFERAYTVGTTPKPTTHLERMAVEQASLSKDVVALRKFINSNPIFLTLEWEEQKDMKEQLQGMETHLWHLERRIRRAAK